MTEMKHLTFKKKKQLKKNKMVKEYDRDQKGNIEKKKKTTHYMKMDLWRLEINAYLHLTIEVLMI